MRFVVLGLSLSLSILGAQAAQAQDAQSWCKSKWGSDDEKGATNLLSPQLVLEAAKLVKTGKFTRSAWRPAPRRPLSRPGHSTSPSCNRVRRPAAALDPPRRPTTTTSSRAGSAPARNSTALATSGSTACISTATRPVSLRRRTALRSSVLEGLHPSTPRHRSRHGSLQVESPVPAG